MQTTHEEPQLPDGYQLMQSAQGAMLYSPDGRLVHLEAAELAFIRTCDSPVILQMMLDDLAEVIL